MTVDEKECVKVIVKEEPIIKAIELKDIAFLEQQPVIVNCPACEAEALSIVRLEAVTCLQRFLSATKLCKNWQRRTDINHYCSKCGCYIGRFVPINCSERCLSRSARKMAANDSMSLKTPPNDCAAQVQRKREEVKAKRASAKAEKEAAKTQETTVVEQVEAK
ncbi:PREDICTED: uncharacterized protein LOC108971195 [Bactrocera latifrons]|uniref:uncharacterized protein LOC108971195 n=1 Tax=Bactrocera latifrons TaxID=174628 RepID=UPI0008DCACCC|nr:PREDICTED: uncharacterized protein LOC108971195 [Bactrocera latifrons]